jgi:hypothetical protein
MRANNVTTTVPIGRHHGILCADAEISRCSCNELLVHLPVCRTV